MVVGLGGLGHLAAKIAAAIGTEATVLGRSRKREKESDHLGAADFAVTSDPKSFRQLERRFEFILDPVSAPHTYNSYVNLLKTDGTLLLVGAPGRPSSRDPFPLLMHRRSIAGSIIGGVRETQEDAEFLRIKQNRV